MNEYWIEVINKLTLMIPALLLGISIGIGIGRKG